MPFALLVSFGALAGAFLDSRFGSSPWLLLGGVVLGAVGAFLNLFRVVSHFQRLDRNDDDDHA